MWVQMPLSTWSLKQQWHSTNGRAGAKTQVLLFFFNFLKMLIYFWGREGEGEKEKKPEWGRAEQDTESKEQAPGSALSAQNPKQGSNPSTARSWPEPKSGAQPTEPPRWPLSEFLISVVASVRNIRITLDILHFLPPGSKTFFSPASIIYPALFNYFDTMDTFGC